MGAGVCRNPDDVVLSREDNSGFVSRPRDTHTEPRESHTVSLAHAKGIPGLGFQPSREAHPSSHPGASNAKLAQAIRDVFYAYPVLESHDLKVHIHRRGQKKLIGDLHRAGAFKVDVHESMADEWSWMESVARANADTFRDSEGESESVAFVARSPYRVTSCVPSRFSRLIGALSICWCLRR